MKFFKNKQSGEVFGYDRDQRDLIEEAKANPEMEDITGSWPPKEDPLIVKEHEVRFKRDILLERSDWTQLPDTPTDKPAWAEYRQALRDITKQSGFPDNVIWPVRPE